MQNKNFKLWNRICAAAAFVISALTYLLTIEPSASFWDCGEFIASSYKLEVGHPPGNPVFQVIARFFTLFGDNMHAAVLVNAMSALCSALTILFLYLTIVFFVKRLTQNHIAICGSALVGALAYAFTDTFWFSAVEGEVYAMSSLFTAVVFWAMTKWYEQADSPRANRWIVLIAFLMGLSIGVHLLNLLAIPALVFLYYFRMREDKPYTFWEYVKIFLIGVAILAVILFFIVPLLPKFAAYVDLFFVNVLHLPYNSGAAFFMVAILALCFWGIFRTYNAGKAFWNTALLCLTTIIIGFSVFSVDIIRSCAKTPTNEYQPDNAFTLVRYLNREQYGKSPLLYGQYFDAPYDLKNSKYWAPLNGQYKKVNGPVDADYRTEGKMLFPRMWSNSSDGRFEKFYKQYTEGRGRKVEGATEKKPLMRDNLYYFFDYQLNWMYWRYFMWNFVGRQNEIHSPSPGDIFHGNWESGIGFMDALRLSDQSDAPDCLAKNKGKNHYFFLPLLLGLLGLFFQFDKDKRGCWLTFLMFFMTGIAIVLYLNQPPYQVRERDYAYAGSFYFFCVWIGLSVAAVSEWVEKALKGRYATATSLACTGLFLCVPALMAAQNWDDHDRSNRRTAVEMASNYLNSVPANGILITHGDNDTFPLWYAQEVENIRTDVRVVNTSLLGTDWHIDQMKYACNESAPLPLKVGMEQYLYGENDFVPIYDSRKTEMKISDVMAVFRSPECKVSLQSGRKVDYIPSRRIIVPVNRDNIVKCGILDAKYYEQIPDSIVLNIPKDKEYLSKGEIFVLDLLSNYQWDRPLCLLSMGGDINVGLKEWFEYRGYSYMFVPFKSKTTSNSPGFTDPDELYRLMTEVYKWDAVGADDYCIDYQNQYTHLGVMPVRGLFSSCAEVFYGAGHKDWALEMVEKGCETMKHYPLETIPLGFSGNDYTVVCTIEQYLKLGQTEKGLALAEQLSDALVKNIKFYIPMYEYAKNEVEMCGQYIYLLSDVLKQCGQKEAAKKIEGKLAELYRE